MLNFEFQFCYLSLWERLWRNKYVNFIIIIRGVLYGLLLFEAKSDFTTLKLTIAPTLCVTCHIFRQVMIVIKLCAATLVVLTSYNHFVAYNFLSNETWLWKKILRYLKQSWVMFVRLEIHQTLARYVPSINTKNGSKSFSI